MRVAFSLLRLTRLDTSLILSLAIFAPHITRTRDVCLSFRRALPLLLIGMCTFIANDLEDIEKDRTNHPERPLPSGRVSPILACVLYFTCLILALLTTKWFVDPRIAFWYYALLSLSISYGYVVEFSPGLKSPYVAVSIALPIIIAANFFPKESRFHLVAAAVFLFSLGRELCMDLADRAGDQPSFMHRIEPMRIAVGAMVSQGLALTLIALQIHGLVDTAVLLLMTTVLLFSFVYWFKLKSRATAIGLMKLQLLIGLYFLL